MFNDPTVSLQYSARSRKGTGLSFIIDWYIIVFLEFRSYYAMMIPRRLLPLIIDRLDAFPAVALLGPRQSGKTTLALELASTRPSIYLDLEAESDRVKLAEPAMYLSGHEDKLVVIDEVHRAPGLFQELRGLIDAGRRRGRRTGRFLLLGSASVELLRQSGETLAGRIAYCELAPLDMLEVADRETLWVRGGFPDSLLAEDQARSLVWRQEFIRTYLERDVPQLGPRIPAETLRRFWTMLAHGQGTLLNAADLARSLGVDGKTVATYLDLMVDLLLVRRLEPWSANIKKRLVKSPRIYVRDSGVLHALLSLGDREGVLGHPIAGASWEGFVLESLIGVAPDRTRASFYRTAAGAEIDLVLDLPNGETWVIEIKRSLTPKPARGFWSGLKDVAAQRAFIVYPGDEPFPVAEGVSAVPPTSLMRRLSET